MKKLQLLVVLLVANFSLVFAQDGEEDFMESSVEISMDFNKSLYPVAFGNTYASESPKAALFASVNPQSFEEAISEFEKDFSAGELKNVKSGTTDIKGQKVFYVTGNMTDETGVLVLLEILLKPATKDSCIVVMSMYESESKKTFEQEGKKAIASAKII